MTKEEAIKMLTNTKVYVDGKSEEIQNKLIELGFRACVYESNKEEYHYPFLFIGDDLFFEGGCDMIKFKEHPFKNISSDEILNIKIDKIYKFTPFEKVLVRDYNSGDWIPDFFCKLNLGNEYTYQCVGGYVKQCIPYEGNEKLLGTTNKPED